MLWLRSRLLLLENWKVLVVGWWGCISIQVVSAKGYEIERHAWSW